MFVRVAPIRRFPRGAHGFDYRVRDGMHAPRGAFVWIPLRKRLVEGVVIMPVKTSFIERVSDIVGLVKRAPLCEGDMSFYEALAAHTGESLSTILYAALPGALRRTSAPRIYKQDHTTLSVSRDHASATQGIVQHILKTPHASVAIASRRLGMIAALGLVRTSTDPVLILCSSRDDAVFMAQLVAHATDSVRVYGGAMSKSVAYE
ncbi:hypothetical protein HYV72_00410 [Candidatus Uhrbacteria bacterium]|nr:hypothetical protein [Candidatus Uhrbacteria bacterium]